MRNVAGWLVLGSVMGCTRPPPAAPRAPRTPLVVTVVVDQFAAWVADDRLAQLPENGGFARLRREGTWFHRARYEHAATDTAPGHSSLYTGVPPKESGIQANELPDETAHRISFLRDEHTRLVAPEGPTEAVGSSIARLRVPTLADRFREVYPDAVVVSVSLKDRGAIFGGGRHPTAVLWFDPSRDSFVTSTAFATQFPAWAVEAGRAESVRALRGAQWALDDDTWVHSHTVVPDNQTGEGNLDGWGTTFPHRFADARRPGSAMRASPYGDEAVLALGAAAVQRARVPGRPMLLALSLSSNDYVGHLFGPDSWEAWDNLRRLDGALARFFHTLDTTVGPTGWSLVLSGDHGVVNLPEVQTLPAARPWCAQGGGADAYERPCGTLSRLDPDVVTEELRQAAANTLGAGEWVRLVVDPFVYLTPAANALDGARKRQLLNALTARLRAHPEVERVVETEEVPMRCPDGDSVEALICRSIPVDNGAALYAQVRAGAFFDAGYTPGMGTSHGSPYLFDRTVPLIVRGPGVDAGREVTEPVSFRAFREHAERLLGSGASSPL